MRLLTIMAGLLIIAAPATAQNASSDAPETVVPSLWHHTAEFEREVIEVTDGVWVASGFALANSIMVEGDDGVVIVDVTESVEEAEAVWAAFQQVTYKPIVALIYTHNHPDHTFGGRGFVPEGDIPVYAHDTTNFYLDRVINIVRPIIGARSARMFGTYLEEGPEGRINNGIGPFLGTGGANEATIGIIRPNQTFSDTLDVELAGVQFHLEHAPGETNDQILVWLPEKRVLLPGDNIYRAFPNLYTIRGTPYRDVAAWVRSLDRMRALRPAYVVPSHTRPLEGEDDIQETLTVYRDAIQFVHDQTIRGMNLGLTPDELVEYVRLPARMASHPFLLEHYGTVEWSVRNIFNGYLGWFDGDAAFLSPAPVHERAEAIVGLAGGIDGTLAALRAAHDEGQHRWAAELATYVLAVDSTNEQAAAIKAASLRALGFASTSPAGRNYYLTQALELEGVIASTEEVPTAAQAVSVVRSFPMSSVMASLPVRLNPARAAEKDIVAGFRFTDTGETFTIHIRNSVADLQPGFPDDPDVAIATSTESWIEIITRNKSLPLAIATFDLRVTTGALTIPRLVEFLTLFGDDAVETED